MKTHLLRTMWLPWRQLNARPQEGQLELFDANLTDYKIIQAVTRLFRSQNRLASRNLPEH